MEHVRDIICEPLDYNLITSFALLVAAQFSDDVTNEAGFGRDDKSIVDVSKKTS